jgi:hypothetical protein
MFTKGSLHDVINWNTRNNEDDLQCESNEQLSSIERFAVLIKSIATKYNKRVVILIDEYDKPVLILPTPKCRIMHGICLKGYMNISNTTTNLHFLAE